MVWLPAGPLGAQLYGGAAGWGALAAAAGGGARPGGARPGRAALRWPAARLRPAARRPSCAAPAIPATWTDRGISRLASWLPPLPGLSAGFPVDADTRYPGTGRPNADPARPARAGCLATRSAPGPLSARDTRRSL